MSLGPERFSEYFQAIHGHEPFPWQTRLLNQVLDGQWPATLGLPTASGKTACIDIAVFALACQAAQAIRRIFFVVDRRVIVDEAFVRARRIASALATEADGVLGEVRQALCHIGGSADAPLAVFQLRGGIYRDDAWARSPAQPTVVCATVDQIGSRLLFRSYGSSPYAWPLHAGLAANDALVLLDEAHCAEPFRQTLDAIARYRAWAKQPCPTPFAHVVLSATPAGNIGTHSFQLDAEDRAHPTLSARLSASKPARLVEGKGKTATTALSRQIAGEAIEFARRGARRVGVIVNRIATAREVHEMLGELGVPVERRALFIGRMRPWDRDRLLERWQPTFAADPQRQALESSCFAVATQCLEVGANLDFDALVTECASLDALRQRFGRLFRLGRSGVDERSNEQVAAIVLPKPEPRQDDPIYGEAIETTWRWLAEHATDGLVDLGVDAIDALLPVEPHARASLLAERKLVVRVPDAPVMLPAHVDAWAQTSPAPWPDPEPALFLHGPRKGVAEVQVCWRQDLDATQDTGKWPELVSLVAPGSAECMSVPMHALKRWLRYGVPEDAGGDVDLGDHELDSDTAASETLRQRVVRWRGASDVLVLSTIGELYDLRPGDTLVLPASAGGWSVFGAVVQQADGRPLALDIADEVQLTARLRPVLRLVPALLDSWPPSDACDALRKLLDAEEIEQRSATGEYRMALKDALRAVADGLPHPASQARDWTWLRVAIAGLTSSRSGFDLDRHPSGGLVLTARRCLRPDQVLTTGHRVPNEVFSAEDDSASFTVAVPLPDHLEGVAQFVERFASACGLEQVLIEDLRLAASLHDLGKADPRFQAWLRGGVPYPVPVQYGAMLAKSGGASSPAAIRRARERAGYPEGGRHELLSVRLVESNPEMLTQAHDPELVLHLIASHHGRCRPFAPVVMDPEPRSVDLEIDGRRLSASTDTELERLDSGQAERFWTLVRRYGWWGLAYLEAIHVLADHRRSEAEQLGMEDSL